MTTVLNVADRACKDSRAYCLLSYCLLSYCLLSYCLLSYCLLSYCLLSYCLLSYCLLSYCLLSYCLLSYCLLSYCLLSPASTKLAKSLKTAVSMDRPLQYANCNYGKRVLLTRWVQPGSGRCTSAALTETRGWLQVLSYQDPPS